VLDGWCGLVDGRCNGLVHRTMGNLTTFLAKTHFLKVV